jgi:hydroxyacylglutathione hydrolase
VPARSHPLRDGDQAELASLGLRFEVLGIPGHTRGHIAYFGHGALFSGDTLFSGGCGRVFEGTPEQMLASLERLAALPEDSLLYCGHEYTVKNLEFCLAVEPDNPAVRRRLADARAAMADGRPTLPARLADEFEYNVFLRCGEDTVRAGVETRTGSALHSTEAVFAAVRHWKDTF